MVREYHTWFSPILNKEMELLVFGHAGHAVLFFPTRGARFYDYENWGVLDKLHDKINAGLLQIYCVDSIDKESFYSNEKFPEEKINRHVHYENYIIKEVIPFVNKKNKNAYKIVAGCSMGAFHAVNIALRHPKLFNKVVGMSGRYDLTKKMGDFNDLFNGFFNDTIYYNMPNQFLNNLNDTKILKAISKLDITIAIGKTDAFLENNIYLTTILNKKKINHNFIIWEQEAHKPPYWKDMVWLYF
ncbi:MAG: esterase [Sphingobacteriales bacterium]|nr:MAG: esterase [Sphingobacteriales bacterium]TAF79368.1 MAG: esterase [Sphingobacteriales bacterium]